MIWSNGRIVAETDLAIPVTDRTFEHGLGLFETLRTWSGRPVLLDRHLARMRRSAESLGLVLDPLSVPDASAVAELVRANQIEGDARLRITLTGGTAPVHGSIGWMRAGPLTTLPTTGIDVLGFWTVALDDPLAQHKTLNAWRKRLAHEQTRELGRDESLSRSPDGLIWEGSRTNLFWVVGQTLETSPRTGPILPGIMRELVLEQASQTFSTVLECPADLDRLIRADEVFLTNAVSAIIPVRSLAVLRNPEGTEPAAETVAQWPAPGPKTAQLDGLVRGWLNSGGGLRT